MVTSDNFDIYPVEAPEVLKRTFDNLVGFNNKNKKRKFMKEIKEEWDPVKGFIDPREIKKQKEAKEAEFKKKLENGSIKVVNLDKKKTTTKKAAEKKEDAEYKGNLINKAGKKQSQIDAELKARIARKDVEKKDTFKNDTDYTVKEIVEYAWKHSAKIREKFGGSPKAFEDEVKNNEKFRKMLNDKMINKVGSKETKVVKTRKAADPTLETDVFKIANYFFSRKKEYKDILDGITDISTFRRMLQKDPDTAKKFALIMKNQGVIKEEDEDKDDYYDEDLKEEINEAFKNIDKAVLKAKKYISSRKLDAEFAKEVFQNLYEEIEEACEQIADINISEIR